MKDTISKKVQEHYPSAYSNIYDRQKGFLIMECMIKDAEKYQGMGAKICRDAVLDGLITLIEELKESEIASIRTKDSAK